MLAHHKIKTWLRNGLIPCLLALGILVTTVPLAYSQTSSPSINQQTGAPVVLGDETLFYIQERMDSLSPESRAQATSNQIATFAQDTESSLDTLKIVDNESARTIDIQAGEQRLVSIADVDAAASGKSRKELANQYLQTIKDSVIKFRSSYDVQIFLRGSVYSLIATVVLIVGCIAITKSSPIIYLLRRWSGTRIPPFTLFGTQILSSHRVVDLISEVIKLIRLALFLGLLYLYVNLILSFFPRTQELARVLFSYVQTAIKTLGSGLLGYLPNLFFLLIIWFLTSYSLKVIRFLFTEIERGDITIPGFYREWAQPTYDLTRFFVLAFAATVAFPYLPGSQTQAFQGVSIFLGLLISLGSSSAIANILAGVILTYTRAFLIGDRVQIDDTIGDVIEKTLFVTRVLTIKNVVITIPNSSLLGSHVINYSSAVSDSNIPPLILNTTITLGYDNPWRKVHDVLIEAALATAQILENPAPFVLQTSLDDFYVSYELNAYTSCPSVMEKIYSDLHQNIQDKCNEADIEIMSPHYRAARDGNQTTIPSNYLPPDYEAPGFRLSQMNSVQKSENENNTLESDRV